MKTTLILLTSAVAAFFSFWNTNVAEGTAPSERKGVITYFDESVLKGTDSHLFYKNSDYVHLPTVNCKFPFSTKYEIVGEYTLLFNQIDGCIETYKNSVLHSSTSTEAYNHFSIDRINLRFLISNSNTSTISQYSFDGSLIASHQMKTHMLSAFYFGPNGHIAVYAPQRALQGQKALQVYNSNMEFQHELIELESIVNEVPLVANHCIRAYDQHLYYCPILSDKVYEIFEDGSQKIVFSGIREDAYFADQRQAIKDLPVSDPWAINAALPINDYFVTDDQIVFKNYDGKRYLLTLVDRKSNNAVQFAESILVSNIEGIFDLTIDNVQGAQGNAFYKVYPIDKLKEIVSYYHSNHESPQINAGLAKVNVLNQGTAIHTFDYNFDFIFSNSVGKIDPIEAAAIEIKLYPSIASTQINLAFNSESAIHDLSYDIVATNGQAFPEISIESIHQSTIPVDISAIDDGYYLLRIIHMGKVIKALPFIKSN